MEIYFDDLSEEKQKEVLNFYGFKNKYEMNWDTFPLFVLEKDKFGG